MKKNIILTAFSLLLLYGCTGDMERIQTGTAAKVPFSLTSGNALAGVRVILLNARLASPSELGRFLLPVR
jgi:hypothetical protein